MIQPALTLSWLLRIRHDTPGEFAQRLFQDSYAEFLMQAQSYDQGGKLNTFADMMTQNPKALSMHYKVGFSIGAYLNDLGGRIPGLFDEAGQPVSFEKHRFEIFKSDTKDRRCHEVGVHFIFRARLVANLGAWLVLARTEPPATFTLRLQPGLSVVAWESGAEAA